MFTDTTIQSIHTCIVDVFMYNDFNLVSLKVVYNVCGKQCKKYFLNNITSYAYIFCVNKKVSIINGLVTLPDSCE